MSTMPTFFIIETSRFFSWIETNSAYHWSLFLLSYIFLFLSISLGLCYIWISSWFLRFRRWLWYRSMVIGNLRWDFWMQVGVWRKYLKSIDLIQFQPLLLLSTQSRNGVVSMFLNPYLCTSCTFCLCRDDYCKTLQWARSRNKRFSCECVLTFNDFHCHMQMANFVRFLLISAPASYMIASTLGRRSLILSGS